jgi:hypothetical protein
MSHFLKLADFPRMADLRMADFLKLDPDQKQAEMPEAIISKKTVVP